MLQVSMYEQNTKHSRTGYLPKKNMFPFWMRQPPLSPDLDSFDSSTTIAYLIWITTTYAFGMFGEEDADHFWDTLLILIN